LKVIIVGIGKTGYKLAGLLGAQEKHEVTVIDTRSESIRTIVNEWDIMGITGNATDVEILEEAGIKDTDLLIAVTGNDEVNLLTCLIAKKAGNCKTIARVRKKEYRRSLGLFKDDLGLAMAINPEYAAASEIARILRFPSAIQIDTFAKGRIEILKFKIQEKSPIDDIKICDMGKKLNCDILVCGVERGDKAYIPGGNFILKAGDFVSIVATPQSATNFFKTIGIKTNRVKDALIIGGGDTGYYLADILMDSGIAVKIIEQDLKRCEELCELLPGAHIINGDGTNTDLLMEEGISGYEAVVSLTGIDEENIMLSLFAGTKTDGKTVTKINRISYDKVIESLDLGTIVNPNNITAEHIERFVRAKDNSLGGNVETMHLILDGKAEALEFKITGDMPICGVTFEEISLKDNVVVACINRGNKVILPRGKDCVLPGDNVIVVTTQHGVMDIKEILR